MKREAEASKADSGCRSPRAGDAEVSFVRFQAIIADYLGLDPEELVTCGVSLGYADVQAKVNQLNMPREPPEGFARWMGFDE